ncbi:SusC/RagA family TonB-linked outer membrane protein [Flavivirga eckloniae]|uniref:SusC/RagA family TonB-linked outer membrane protein n=2 Tax=Flavivirga eckloniae TaxID=1803846 RepID=A0A2K9PWW0_9FLAO|nr:SusC/RagA family TonB-linked outer membrane protein [Flavivirga eckloniae]
MFKGFPNVHLKKGVIRLNKLLSNSLSGKNINVIFSSNNTIIIKEKIHHSKAQQHSVSGSVKDQNGVPVAGVTVLIKGTNKGVVTDFDGLYEILVQDPANVLVFSSMGFESQEITVGNQTTINVSLNESLSELDEVVIKGYYKSTKRKETGSVASITAKTIEKQPVDNPLAAMQGHLSGVNISQNTGLPGANLRIQIRGQNFLDRRVSSGNIDNDPLYVIDGIPYSSATLESTFITDHIIGQRVSPLNSINPANIKSIEVLKDADATAIYGSRGANGVVLITTKKGQVGKTKVKLDVSTTLSHVPRFVNLLNTEQYLGMRQEALINDNLWPVATEDKSDYPDLFIWDQSRYTDWQKVLIGGTGYRQNAQLSLSGGSAQTQFLLSGGYVSQSTVFPGDFMYNKASVQLNTNHQSKNERFKLNVSVNYSGDTNNLPGTDLTAQARILPPNAPALYDDQGNLNWENSTWLNPLAILETKYNAVTRSLIANTVLSYSPISSLEFKVSMGYTDYRLKSYLTEPTTAWDPNIIQGQDISFSSIKRNEGNRKSWIIEPQMNWKQHWDNAKLKLLIGGTFQQDKNEQLALFARDFPSNDLLLSLSAANFIKIGIDRESEYKFHSIFGRLNFDWKDRYIINLTGRRDGSSRFGPNKRFGNFGAIGALWIFSEEGFLKDNTVLSFGKLRASYGIAGSDTSPDYAFLDTFELDGSSYNGSGLEPTRLYNPNVVWGETKKLEAALELGFFKGRFSISTSWYRNRSSNQLIERPLPTTTGFNGINDNLDAIVENSGIEIDFNSTNIKNNHLKWQTTFNISANRNKLVAFPNLENSVYNNQYVIGKSLSIGKRYHFIGVDSETGIAQFEDYNNDGVINGRDLLRIVDFTPKYFGGLGNTLEYKNFQLNVFFQFKKQKTSSLLERLTRTDPGRAPLNVPVAILNRWRQAGDQNPIQRYSITDSQVFDAGSRYRNSNATVIDASYIRLQSVLLNYRVPKTVTNGLDLNIYLQGQNLFTITSYDGPEPDMGLNTLPPLQQFTLGFNLGF